MQGIDQLGTVYHLISSWMGGSSPLGLVRMQWLDEMTVCTPKVINPQQ
jgi:hypothetical protein